MRSRLRLHSGRNEAPSGGKRIPSTDEMLRVAASATRAARQQGTNAAVVGGLAMQIYGSSRLTKDVDMIADAPLERKKAVRLLNIGGVVYQWTKCVPVDWILREDDYVALYKDALDNSLLHGRGFRLVSPEHLAAMKFAAQRQKDYDDLMWLLQQDGLVNSDKARRIIFRFVGGRFAADQFDAAVEEARWRARKGE